MGGSGERLAIVEALLAAGPAAVNQESQCMRCCPLAAISVTPVGHLVYVGTHPSIDGITGFCRVGGCYTVI